MRITALSPAAAALGLTTGLALAGARAQLPDLAAVAHDATADRRWLEGLADGCDRYTPMVALDPPDALVLDITGCAHRFDDERALAVDLRARLQRQRLHVRIGRGASPEAAQALARFGGGEGEADALHRLPVAALRLDDAAETALRRAGLATIGDLAARPSGPVAARFGALATAALDRLLGRADSRIVPRRPLPALSVERRFAEPIAQADAALAVLGELLGEAMVALGERGQGGRRFAVRFYRSDGAVRDLAVETGQPSRDAAAVARLFAERIEGLADPIDPGFGFDMIRLAVAQAEPLAPAQHGIGGGEARDDAIAALVDRLAARLGHARVRRFLTRDTHVPERAAAALPIANPKHPLQAKSRTGSVNPATADRAPWPLQSPGPAPSRPLHLLDPPQPVEVIAEVPDGPPRRFRWRQALHEVTRAEGPERIAPEWWHDAAETRTRDYYRIEDAAGRRFWLFRHGLFGGETGDGEGAPLWYVHGLFA